MKKIIFLVALMLCTSAAFAQKDNVAYDSDDAWFVSAGYGGNLTVLGFSLSNGLSMGGVSSSLDLAVGKWVIPSIGLRVGYSGLSYDNNFGSDQTNSIGYIHGDLIVDPISYINGYDSERFYTPQPYVSAGILQCWDNGGTDFALAAGLFNAFRITKNVDINADFRALAYKNNYLQALGTNTLDLVLSATVGVTYKFGRKATPNNSANDAAVAAAAAAAYEREIDNLKQQVEDANKQAEDAKAQAEAAEAKAQAQPKPQPHRGAEQKAAPTESAAVAPRHSEKPVQVKPVVIFDISSSSLNESSKVVVAFWAESIKANPNKSYTVVGYADNTTGSAEINEKISKARAEAVADVLINTYGVDSSQIKVDYKGGVALQIDGVSASSRVVVLE